MMGGRKRVLGVSLLPVLLSLSLGASAQNFEFLPEVDVYGKISSSVRLIFQAKDTREDGEPVQAEIGPSIEFLLKPLVKLRRASLNDRDESKSRLLALSFGYRYVASPDAAVINRVLFIATPNLPIGDGFLISDRNRGELNFSAGDLTWRYRNMPTIQRAVAIHSYHLTPYASAEFYYDSKYEKWSSTALYAGARFPLGKHTQIDPYYEHENNTGKKPNQQLNMFGLVLNLYF